MKARDISRNEVLGEAIRESDTFFSRAKGLLRPERLAPGEGLWIFPCRSIHSFGMRFEFDALFLDSQSKVIGLYNRFRKNRISRYFWTARGVLELPEGTIETTGTEGGEEIEFPTCT